MEASPTDKGSIFRIERITMNEEAQLAAAVIKQFFRSVMLHEWKEVGIDKLFTLLHDPETDIHDCDKQMKSIISEMDWGDIPRIIDVYIQASHCVESGSGVKLKHEHDTSWYNIT